MADIYHAFQEGRGQEVPILIVGTVGKQNGKWQVHHTGWYYFAVELLSVHSFVCMVVM